LRGEAPRTRFVSLKISTEEYDYIKDKADAKGKVYPRP